MKAVDVSRPYLVDLLMRKAETLHIECCASLCNSVRTQEVLVHIILLLFRMEAHFLAKKEKRVEKENMPYLEILLSVFSK